MRYVRFAILIAVLVARPGAAQYAPSHFVPAVEFRDTVATCLQPAASLQPGERGLSLQMSIEM